MTDNEAMNNDETMNKIIITVIMLLNTVFVFGQSSYIVVNKEDTDLLREAKVLGRKQQTLTLENYPEAAEKIVQYLENHGYPFASVNLSTEWENDTTPLYRMNIEPGRYTKVDSIVLKGDLKLSQSYLWPYLGLRRNAPYSEKTVQEVAQKLHALPFATVVQQPGISFEEDKTVLYIYLDKKKVNRFDGYIGFEPVNELSGKLAIMGELSLDLQNIFHIGERLSLKWRSSERYSQYLNIDAEFPYLFRTRFGIDGHFRLDKQDTTYLTLNYHIGIPYHLRPDSYIRPYIDITQSQLLNKKAASTTWDSDFMDYRNILYGLSFEFSNLVMNEPSKFGYFLAADAAAGRRTLLPSHNTDEPNPTDLVKTTYRISGEAMGLIPLFKHRFYLMLTTKAGSLLSGPHYLNEMFKIGGEGQIRGFTENELLASTYLLYSAELRYLFGRNNDVHLFFDGGTYEQQGYNSYLFDNPFGFGAGINIKVKSGTFYFDYALPRQRGNKISFKTGKIHFGVKVAF